MSYSNLLSPATAQKIGGVTLIELMIAITLVALLLGLGVPSFGTWIQNTQIRTSAESILNGFNLARAEAVRRNAPTSFVFTNNLPIVGNVNTITPATTGTSWMVRTFQTGGVYTATDFIQGRSGADGSPNAVVAASQATITFNSLGRVTPTPGANITINVTNNTGGTRPLNVVVTPGGQIRMCDPNLPTANVQSC
ncbi:MAG: GspH/FimT family pseudopilin [Pseudomonadota bacterium]|mgnify:CR=1 FL=1